ncbi:class I SAM-dependent methyltransferase [Algicella marina]|uniref:Methyltransferase domain-containing protein n=1 Tax=Algicella marina TaxID=2683284 RepID=A0A6P1SXD5_9RHOB|nr:class I SAM-dependent methyltransferase [Algicella marina]QHQ34141.1 methyltransferase domain-containing protein [Algicella marina]
MPRSPFFWNIMARRYARQPIADEASYQRKLEITQSYLRPEMELLEFGCGTGSTALIHAPHVRHIQAIDFSPRMIEIARQRAADARTSNVTFQTATIEELAEPGGSYDAILGLSIIHLLEDRAAVLGKVHGLLKPGGLFVSSTACIAEMGWLPRFLVPVLSALRILPNISVFDRPRLIRDLEEAGFTIEQNWHPGPGKAVFIVARKR